MAIFSNFVVAICALATIAGAVPMNLRRDLQIVTETAYTTVDVSVELIVDQNGNAIQTIVPSGTAPMATTSAAIMPASSSVPAPSAPLVNSQDVAPVTSTTFVTMAPTTTAAPPPVATVVPESSSSVAPAAPASSSSANSGTSGSTDAGQIVASATNTCTSMSNACEGDITHWDGGLGACGTVIDTNSDFAIALPYEFMGTLSNTNPYCGRSLTIHNPDTGAQVQAVVGDKCMGCNGRAIDLTNALFNAIAPSCDGRCSGFEWWFN